MVRLDNVTEGPHSKVPSSIKGRSAEYSSGCIGSKCMMWRWDDETTLGDIQTNKGHGFCGLAGVP